MGPRGVLRALSVAGLAFAGLVGGHAIGYLIAVPDAHHRSTLVAETGHGYLPSVAWAACVLGLAAVVAGIAAGYVRRAPGRRRRFGRAAVSMGGLQAIAFVLVEVFERLAAGAPLDTFSQALLVIGIAVQLVVGFAAVLVLRGLRELGSVLRGRPRRPSVVAARSLRLLGDLRVARPAFAPDHVRGPPALTAA